jgi:hypothetical protein
MSAHGRYGAAPAARPYDAAYYVATNLLAPPDRGLAPTCGTVGGRSPLLVEISFGSASCGVARSVVGAASKWAGRRFAIGGWECERSPAWYKPTLITCTGRTTAWLQGVPFAALRNAGYGCRMFAGPGDSGIHAANFRARGVGCARARRVLRVCNPDGRACRDGDVAWTCEQYGPPSLGYAERCRSASAYIEIVWLD